jgi:hypothetical protein
MHSTLDIFIHNFILVWTLLADPRYFLVLAILASFRLAEMVAVDAGPFNIFFELRSWANDTDFGNWNLRRTFHDAIACVHCSGLYFAFVIVIGYMAWPKVAALIIFPLAIAGGQSLIAGRFGRQDK